MPSCLTNGKTYLTIMIIIFSMQSITSFASVDEGATITTAAVPDGESINTKYLSITNHSYYDDVLFTIVNGTVINNSSNSMNSVIAVVEYYDDFDNLITTDSGTVDMVILNPGGNSSFTVNTELGNENVSRYRVIPGGNIGR